MTVMAYVYDHASGKTLPWILSKASYDRLMAANTSPKLPQATGESLTVEGLKVVLEKKTEFVCSTCGVNNYSMKRPCVACGSRSVVPPLPLAPLPPLPLPLPLPLPPLPPPPVEEALGVVVPGVLELPHMSSSTAQGPSSPG